MRLETVGSNPTGPVQLPELFCMYFDARPISRTPPGKTKPLQIMAQPTRRLAINLVDITTEVTIDRTRNAVSEFAVDPDNAPKWYENIKSVEWKTERPLVLGSKIAFRARFMGRELSYVYEVLEFTPGEKLVMRTPEGQMQMETTYVWEDTEDKKTRMTLRNRGSTKGFSRLFAPFMSSAMRRANRKDLERLKLILEKGQ